MAADTATTTTAARRQMGKKEWEGGEMGGKEEGDPPPAADGLGQLCAAAAIACPGGQVEACVPGGIP
jgi:hypothetical protein